MALRELSKRGGEPVITPLLNKKTGKPLTNAQIIRNTDKVLTMLKESKDPKDQILFSNMINNDQHIYNYIHEVASIEDDAALQQRLNETLLPNPALAAELAAFEKKANQAAKKAKVRS